MSTARTRGLLLPVGISPEPIVYTLRQLQPEFVAMVATPRSQQKLEEVFQAHPMPPHRVRIETVEDSPQNIGLLILVVYELYRWLTRHCEVKHEEIAVDPTPARKWMSAGVTMLASQLGLEMVYVDVQFDQNRKAIPDSMKLIRLGNAFEQTGFLAADRGRQHFNRGQFAAAAEAWESIWPARAQERLLYQGLAQLARTLHRWDLFEHYQQSLRSQFHQALELLQSYCRGTVGSDDLLQFVQQMEELAQAVEKITTAEKPAIQATADLLANARRRMAQGQYDDACARLYRALESVAQFILHDQYQLDVSRPDWENHEPIRQAATEAFGDSLPEQLALNNAWVLLWVLNDPVARSIVFPNKKDKTRRFHFKFQPLLDRRNNSILAHGWNAVTKTDVSNLAREVQQALTANQPALAQWLEKLQVPRLPELPLTRPDA